jgi:rhodanese-related sulfurtransferase
MTMAVCSHLNQLTLAFVGATGGMAMRLISAREFKDKLDRSDPLKLVNALGDWEYRAAHIPGSLHFSTPEETLRGLGRDDEIIVHCSSPLLYGQRRAATACRLQLVGYAPAAGVVTDAVARVRAQGGSRCRSRAVAWCG